MTIRFGNFVNFIVRIFVVIWEAPIDLGRDKARKMFLWGACPFLTKALGRQDCLQET